MEEGGIKGTQGRFEGEGDGEAEDEKIWIRS